MGWGLFPAEAGELRGLKKSTSKTRDQLQLKFRALGRVSESKDWFVLAPNGTLHSGDRIAFEVELTRPAYVYLFFEGPSGDAALLYPPNGAHHLVGPDRPVRVPDHGRSLKLDDNTGREVVYVVASAQRVPNADKGLDAVRASFGPKPSSDRTKKARPKRPDRRPAPHKPVEPPPRLSLQTRGLVLVEEDKTVSAKPDAEGFIVYPFVLNHAP